MEEHVQNIVVGAGIAGLICGGYLAKHGQKGAPSSWQSMM